MSFESDYVNLLIKQYWEKPKASAEVEFKAGVWRKTFEWIDSFSDEFDLDNATGDRLDIIGRIVGINRIVPFVVAKIAFGFSENANARGFEDKFNPLVDRAQFQDKFERDYTSLQLDDIAYRFFIRAKISRNTGGPYLVDDRALSIQDSVNTLFSGSAYVIDQKNMTLVLYVSPRFNFERLLAIIRLDLLPKPQGVSYKIITEAGPGETFGFSENVNSLPFADKFNMASQPGGRFANKVIF